MSQDDVLLDRVLRPNPPLPPRVLGWILGTVTAINAGFALSFALRGAWPMAPFLGLDVALLAWAFRTSVRAARREEHLTLTPSTLRVQHRPRVRDDVELNPYWVRVELPERGPLTLWSHGRSVGIGAFLCPDEKVSLAHSLKDALWRLRHPR